MLINHLKDKMSDFLQLDYTLDDFFDDIIKSKDCLKGFKIFEIIYDLIYKEGTWEGMIKNSCDIFVKGNIDC